MKIVLDIMNIQDIRDIIKAYIEMKEICCTGVDIETDKKEGTITIITKHN